ncbi:MAG: sulfotransferase [Planctomycetota bacterium]
MIREKAAERVNAMPAQSAVLLVSQGRSGSNWLLGVLDQSPFTHCRNDANAVAESPFARLPDPVAWSESMVPALEAGFDDALASARERMGARNPRSTVPKTHLHTVSRALGLVAVVQRRTSRFVLGSLMPSLRREEWRLPRWIGRPDALTTSTFVVKLGLSAGWIPWVLRRRPSTHVAHVIRHPGGYLASWSARYLMPRDRAAITCANRTRLRVVAALDPLWAPHFAHTGDMSAEEAELWYWAYCTDTVRRAGATSARYTCVRYEDLLADVRGTTRGLFERIGLPWSAAVEQRVRATTTHPPEYAIAWRKYLGVAQRALVARVLERSGLADVWRDVA